jgi:hemolysin activation/secretion protein
MKRVNYFDMSTFNFIYGFKWKGNSKNEHELNPVNIAYTRLGNESVTFLDLLESNPFLKKSYEEQFISGGNYSFTYNEQSARMRKLQIFFQGTAETAGNLFSLAKTVTGEKPSPEAPSRIFGSIYSQYVKFSVDLRTYYKTAEKDKLALRVFAGVARPFGNSSVLPYTRQFFSGGPNSLRAFQINSVGPGTTFEDNDNRGFLNLGGEIKVELNAEYRFNIYRFLNGALFIDAGNVWLNKSNPANTGSPFMFSTFLNEMAAGTGIGLRIDVSFFVLRFDIATPLRKPWLESSQRWVVDEINFASPSWRKDNLIFNIALGYPF